MYLDGLRNLKVISKYITQKVKREKNGIVGGGNDCIWRTEEDDPEEDNLTKKYKFKQQKLMKKLLK